jgi:hypothetical protein
MTAHSFCKAFMPTAISLPKIMARRNVALSIIVKNQTHSARKNVQNERKVKRNR